jgi:hypothetical protein
MRTPTLLMALIPVVALAQPVPPVLEKLTITFERASADGSFLGGAGGSNAVVELGPMSDRGGSRRWRGSKITSTRALVRVRIDSRAGARFARLQAQLQSEGGQHRVLVNGILLSSAPQLIDAHAPVGLSMTHTIEVQVPASAPPGDLVAPILWIAETDD